LKNKKFNKYEDLGKPQAEFNFHDRGILSEDDIKKMADVFLSESLRKGFKKVLFITGKGLHSKEGVAKIKPFLKGYLLSKSVVERVYDGRVDRGGSGTLEVGLCGSYGRN
jgi:DNA-nicking Smr family endonuclease